MPVACSANSQGIVIGRELQGNQRQGGDVNLQKRTAGGDKKCRPLGPIEASSTRRRAVANISRMTGRVAPSGGCMLSTDTQLGAPQSETRMRCASYWFGSSNLQNEPNLTGSLHGLYHLRLGRHGLTAGMRSKAPNG
jgi:hypothetical protein